MIAVTASSKLHELLIVGKLQKQVNRGLPSLNQRRVTLNEGRGCILMFVTLGGEGPQNQMQGLPGAQESRVLRPLPEKIGSASGPISRSVLLSG